MVRKQIRFMVDEQDAQLRTHVTGKVWDAASRLLHRCRRGSIIQLVVADREPSMKLGFPITGRVF